MTMPIEGPAAQPGQPAGNLGGLKSDDPAMVRVNELEAARTALVARLADPATGYLEKAPINAQIAKLEPQLSAAYREAAVSARAEAKLAQSGGGTAGSSTAAMIQAAAATSRAEALETRANAYAEGTGAKRQQLEADVRLKDAQAKIDGLKADLATATQPDEIDKIHTQLQQALQNLEGTQKDNTAKGFTNTILGAKAGVAPQVEQAGADTATAGATTAKAKAAVQPEMSLADLSAAQSAAVTAQVAAQTAQANFDALTPEMRTEAAQADLAAKIAAAKQAQQTLDFARQLQPGVLAQQGANLAQTQGATQHDLLGPLYGATAKAAEIANQLRAGTFGSGPDAEAKAHQMLQDYITTAMRGTTPYEQQKTALDAETARRAQDTSLAGTQMSSLGSFGSSALSSLGSMNKDAPAGSSSMATAYGGMMQAMMDAQRSMMPSQASSPLLQSMSTGGMAPLAAVAPATAPAAPSAVPTTAPVDPSSVVHAAVSAALQPAQPGAAAPLLPAGAAGTGADPNTGGAQNPAFLSNMGPGLPHHVDALWQNDPNLNPLNSQSLAPAA